MSNRSNAVAAGSLNPQSNVDSFCAANKNNTPSVMESAEYDLPMTEDADNIMTMK